MCDISIQLLVNPFLLQKYYPNPSQDSSSPTPIKQDEAQTVSVRCSGVNGSIESNTNVRVGDTIYWSIDSLGLNTTHTAIIYKIEKADGTQIMSVPEMQVKSFATPVPYSDEPTKYILEDQSYAFLTGDVIAQGTGSYRIFFYIVKSDFDTKKMTTFGYFCWDASITATQIIDRKTIDIFVVIDTSSIISGYEVKSDSDHPVSVNRDAIYMVTNDAAITDGQATADLSIKADVNDAIRWRVESLNGNTDRTAILYDIVKSSGTQITSEAEMQINYPLTPIPAVDNPIRYSPSNNQVDVFLGCSVLRSGSEKYQVRFYIVDRDQDSGELSTSGYYCWDATIHVVKLFQEFDDSDSPGRG